MGPTLTGSILLIDGHGKTDDLTFNFKRPDTQKCNLYSYVFQNVGIGVDPSNKIINDALDTGKVPDGYSDVSSSRIGGTQIKDRLLQTPGTDWSIAQFAALKGWTNRTISIPAVSGDNVSLQVYHNKPALGDSDRVLVAVDKNSTQLVRLSTILNTFTQRAYDVLWMACR